MLLCNHLNLLQHSEQIERRKSTGELLSRDGRYERLDHKKNAKLSSTMPDPKVHEKQEVHRRAERQDELVGIQNRRQEKTEELICFDFIFWLEYSCFPTFICLIAYNKQII